MMNNLKEYEVMAETIIKCAPKIQERKLGVKVLAFADTHYDLLNQDDMESLWGKYHDADIVALLGDHHPCFIDNLLKYFDDEIIVPVLGNHDYKTLYRDFGLKELHGDIKNIKGVNIGGISGSHKYKCSNRYLLISQEESLEVCQKLMTRPSVDLFISHDICFVKDVYDIAHCGLIANTKYIYQKGPTAHLHGHIHNPYIAKYKNGTKELSVYGVSYTEL